MQIISQCPYGWLWSKFLFRGIWNKQKRTPTRTWKIFCDHCVAYFRPLPRTRPQNRRAQTHSRGRARRSGHNENFTMVLSLEFVSALFHLRRGTAWHACIHFFEVINTMLHAQIYTEKRKSEKNWLFTPPLTIYKRTAIRRLPTARNSKTVSFFRHWQQCSSSFCIWSRVAYVAQFLNSVHFSIC